MKLLIMIFLSIFFVSCQGQVKKKEGEINTVPSHQAKIIDTLSVSTLNGEQYGGVHYKVLNLYNNKSDESYLELLRNDNNSIKVSLPNSEDVKNFSVNSITNTDSGFKIAVNWGGGNYFYKRRFSFNYTNDQFVLDNVWMSFYRQEDDKEEHINKQITPSIPIEKFKILDYLQNE